ncbi:glycine cleavage system H protein, mitochondrial-like [Pomacea canaliculata]|uniref:glycine cleavage system H protein, mitochondrial-like n=1 Tax=Pomacea canaliculata TaxID=400727 RepID=UPI000D73D6FD|nr:glycine cleavage system H protein, mitochondrial-like [Pomacea canaliculata]
MDDWTPVDISDYAQDKLGEIVYVQLPEVGVELEKDAEAGCLESVKAASDVYSPVAGKIVEVNEKLAATPNLLNSSPLEDGWIFKLEVASRSDVEGLMNETAYKKFLETQK